VEAAPTKEVGGRSLKSSKKTESDTRYNGLVKTPRQASPGHLSGLLIHIAPPTLSKIGKKRKVPFFYN
jgi:hypothetical protein